MPLSYIDLAVLLRPYAPRTSIVNGRMFPIQERTVGYAELSGRYRRLRSELDAAYAVWNSSRIDQIAAQMAEVERALASAEQGRGRADGFEPSSEGADARATS
jgi:hypothetical protein